jgi:hypothetical protein
MGDNPWHKISNVPDDVRRADLYVMYRFNGVNHRQRVCGAGRLGDGTWFAGMPSLRDGDKVTHWMPVPPPPEGM